MIAPGTYRARAIAGEEEYAVSGSGGEQIIIPLDVNDGATVHRMRTYLAFAGKAGPFSIARLRACGWTGTDVTCLSGIDRNEVDVEVKEEAFQGKMRTIVEIVSRPSAKPLDDAAKRSFRDRMRELAVADPARDAAGQPMPSEPEPDLEPGTDEIPF